MKNNMETKTRNSNIELLRVFSMLMIVAYHYSIYGFYAEDIMYTPNKFFIDIFGMGGKIGTDLFVLISGYYLVNSRFSFKKLFTLVGQMWFYSIGALVIFLLIDGREILSVEVLKLSLFPISSGHYWFITYYLILLLLSPFLNILTKNLTKVQHFTLCVMLFGLCTLMPEFLHLSYADGSLPLFITLYLSAAFCRLHIKSNGKNAKFSCAALLLLMLFCCLRIVLTDLAGQKNMDSVLLERSVNFMGAYSPFAFLIALSLLILFACLKPRHNRCITFVGSTSLGAYLFHDNILVRDVLWQDIFHTSGLAGHPMLFLHAFAVVLIIYVIGTAAETVRRESAEKIWMKFYKVLEPKIIAITANIQNDNK